MNRLLESEIAAIKARIDHADDKLADGAEGGPNERVVQILADLDDFDEMRIRPQRGPHPHAISYNDKRNAIKKEKKRLYSSFHSQEQKEVMDGSPKHAPVLNNFLQVKRKESVFGNARDRNKSANALVRPADRSTQSSKTIGFGAKKAEVALQRSKTGVAEPRMPVASRQVSIDVSRTDSTPTLKVFDKAVADTSGGRQARQPCPNFHFTSDLRHNTAKTPFFDISEAYLLSLAAAEPEARHSFAPSFDSRLSVEMDYSHSIIQPRPSSLVKPPTIADSTLSRPGRVQEETGAAADRRTRAGGRRRASRARRHEAVAQPGRQGRR